MKKIYFDLETTGLDPEKSATHQLAMLVEIDGEVLHQIDWRIKPFEGAEISQKALAIGNVTEDSIQNYTEEKVIYKKLVNLMSKYVNRFDKRDKFHLVGYNNRFFDDRFLRAFFLRNGDSYYGSWFWADSLDVMVLASQFLMKHRHFMHNFKLGTVAQYLGIETEDELLHDGMYDVKLTKQIYEIVTQ